MSKFYDVHFWFCNPLHLNKCLDLCLADIGWLLLYIGWSVLFSFEYPLVLSRFYLPIGHLCGRTGALGAVWHAGTQVCRGDGPACLKVSGIRHDRWMQVCWRSFKKLNSIFIYTLYACLFENVIMLNKQQTIATARLNVLFYKI